ncbi:MAG: c-type cytochrome [Chloroflexi bacterium]|nr:c-type cytochrome [Chloroflexota bacterium]
MLANIVVWLVLLAVALAAGYGVWRAWHLKHPALKWSATPLAGLLTLILALFVVLIGVGIVKAYTPRGNPVVERTVASTPERVARGEHIARVLCSSCHSLVSGELPMSGGKDVLAEVDIPFGVATAPNLTPGGRIDEWSDGELQRVIREGTYPNGHLMTIMSSQTFRVFSQEDLDSIVSYLRSQPAVESAEEPKQSLTPLAMAMLTLGAVPVKPVPDPEVPPAVQRGPTAEYGGYIAGFIDCALCHGDDLSGGTEPFLPLGPNLVTVKSWTAEQFIDTMRTGVSPTRGPLDPDEMPWKSIGLLDDDELTALYEFIKSVR